MQGHVERAVDRGAERIDAEVLEREPDLQSPGRAAELNPAVGEVDVTALDRGVPQIVGHDLECLAEAGALTHEEASGLVGLVKPLVRVERDRVGRLDPAEPLPATLGEHREAAVRGVDMEPDATLRADGGNLLQRIDRARIGRTRIRDDEERPTPRGSIGLHRRREGLGSASAAVLSTGTARTCSSSNPITRIALVTDECPWLET